MSATELESLPGGRGKERNRSPRTVIIGLALVSVLIVGAVGWWAVDSVIHRPERAGHSPISITTDLEFNHANGVVGGSGTEADPYVIADWDIDASTGTGIAIQSTTAHFIIRNCNIHDGSGNFDGILLVHCLNGILSNNICSRNLNGITLSDNCNNDTVDGNTCVSNSHDGIALNGSNNTVSANNCSSNGYDGIYLVRSTNNSLMDSICSSNGHNGICLDRSSGNDLQLNLVSNNAGYGVNISSYYLTNSSNNCICCNVFIGNNGAAGTYDIGHVQACDNGVDNWWNITDVILNETYGNYWSDWTAPNTVAPFSTVDLPYDISGSAGAKDFYPLTFDPRKVWPT